MSEVIRIEIEHEDGMIQGAYGEDAKSIWKAIEGGFVMNHIHGMDYKGPQMKVIRRWRAPMIPRLLLFLAVLGMGWVRDSKLKGE